MKLLVAKRKLKNRCIFCNKEILKGQSYYRKRIVIETEDSIYGYTTYICPKCKWKNESAQGRFEKFKSRCKHPERFVEEIWSYIPGEAVMQPDHLECRLCGERIKCSL